METKHGASGSRVCASGHDNPAGAKFCKDCGSALGEPAICTLGHENSPAQAFCGACGERLASMAKPDGAPDEPIEALDDVVEIELLDAKWRPAMPVLDQYSETVGLTFSFKNRSKQAVRAVTAQVIFLDLFGRTMKTIRLTADTKVLPAGRTVKEDTWSFDLNAYVDDDIWFRNHTRSDMQVIVVVRAILFVDGTLLGDANGAL